MIDENPNVIRHFNRKTRNADQATIKTGARRPFTVEDAGVVDNNAIKIITAVSSAVMAGLIWVVRTIFTNQKKIELIEQKTDLQHNDVVRRMDEVRSLNNQAYAKQDAIVAMLVKLSNEKSSK